MPNQIEPNVNNTLGDLLRGMTRQADGVGQGERPAAPAILAALY